ncbi:MAG: discoidin domain-containing protein, partial [Clostridia bacterium]|nr:discoidin domain-containing protein [Clostridia bacterium]
IFANATLVEVSGLEVEGSNTGDMAFDGDLATRWSSNTDDAAHIIVDLGAVTVVDSLDIYWETACAADYTVEVSEDNANWTVVATVTDNATAASPAGEAVSHSWDAVAARYIKINCTRRNTAWGNSIWEMVAFASDAVIEAPVVEEEAPVEEVVETPAAAEVVEEAAQTFDFGVIAAVAALISAAGYAISKKR